MTKSKKIFVIDFDDYSATKPGHELLVKLKQHYPNFKCTCFTPAFNMEVLQRKMDLDKFKQWGKLLQEDADWIEIAPHGFAHLRGEWLMPSKDQLDMAIRAIENLFKLLEIKIVKVFKAPYWEISKAGEEVLKEYGYTLAIDRNNPKVHTDIPTYVWNWSIDEKLRDYPVIKGHGHIYLTHNGLDRCFANMLNIPQDAEFKFVSEYINENR